MLYLMVHGHGEVIRVLLLSLELGIPDLPSFLQMTRERERRISRQNRSRSLPSTPIHVKSRVGREESLDPRAPPLGD